MMTSIRYFAVVLFTLTSCSAVFAQDRKERVADGPYFTAVSFMVGATALDIESTLQLIRNCPDYLECKEGISFMRPLVEKGRPVLYPVKMGIAAVVSYHSYRLKKNKSRIWWVGPVAVGTVSMIAGGHNLKIILSWK